MSVGWLVSWLVGWSVCQPAANRLVDRSGSKLVGQSISRPMDRLIGWLVGLPTSQYMNQSTGRSVGK